MRYCGRIMRHTRPPAHDCCAIPRCLDLSLVRISEGGLFRVTLTPTMQPVPLGKPTDWRLEIIDSAQLVACGDARIEIEGGMPQCGARWPEGAVVSRASSGEWRIAGLVFTRPGWWLLRLSIEASAGMDFVTFNLAVALAQADGGPGA